MKIDPKLENEILSSTCNECNKGHFRRTETEIVFQRIYDHIIAVEWHILSVPAMRCDNCGKEVISPEVEQRIWDQLKAIENSEEFKTMIHKQKELLRRTTIKQSKQSLDLIYGSLAPLTP